MSLRATIAIGVAVVCLAAVPPLWGQDGACVRRVVAVSVADEEGKPVKGLTAEDFRGKFRGKPVKIVSLEPASEPPRIVVLLDVSESMKSGHRIELARMAAADLISDVPAVERVALLLFSDKVTPVAEFGEDRGNLLERVAQVDYEESRAVSQTALRDAVLEALAVLGAPQSGDVIYVITDAGENLSKARKKDVERALLARGTRLYGFLLVNPGVLEYSDTVWAGVNMISELSERSGGEVLWVRPHVRGVRYSFQFSKERLAILAEDSWRLYQQMLTYYEVEVELPREVDKPRGWDLELVDAQGRRRKHLKVIYPRKLVPCAERESAQ